MSETMKKIAELQKMLEETRCPEVEAYCERMLESLVSEAEEQPVGYYANGEPYYRCDECGLCGDDCDCFRD